MADVSKVVQVVFSAKDEISSKINTIGSSIDGIASPIASATGSILKFEAAAATAGVALVGLSVAAAGKFSDSFNEITTLIDAPASRLNAFKQNLLAYSATSTQALGDITAATYNAVSAGVAFDDATASLAVSEKLAVAGNASLNDSLKLVATSLNSYGVGADEAGKFSDIFFTTVKNGVTTIPELSANLSKVTGIAASTKVPIEELGAAIATMTSKGTATAEATTQLKSLIGSLLNPTVAAAKEFDKLGISYGAVALESVGLTGILKQVNKATGGSVDMAAKLFTSQESLSAVLTLSNDGFATMDKNLLAMNASAGAADAAFAKMANNFSFSNQKMANSINATLIGFGTPLLDEYGSVASAISAVFNGLGAAIEQGALADVTLSVEQWASSLVVILNDVGANMPAALSAVDFSPFLAALQDVTSALGGAFSNVDISTPEGLTIVMQSIVDVSASLVTATVGVIEILAEVGGIIVDAVNWWASLDSGTQKFVGTVGGIAIALTALSPVISGVTAVVLLLNTAIKRNPFVALAVAVASAGAAIYAFSSDANAASAKADAMAASMKKAKAEADFTSMISQGKSAKEAMANLSNEVKGSLTPNFIASAIAARSLAEDESLVTTASDALKSGMLNAAEAVQFLEKNGFSAAKAQASLQGSIMNVAKASDAQVAAGETLSKGLLSVEISAIGVTKAIENMRSEGKTAAQIQDALAEAAKASGTAYDSYVSTLDRVKLKEQAVEDIQALREKSWALRDQAIAEHSRAKQDEADAIQITIDKMESESQASSGYIENKKEQSKQADAALTKIQELQASWKETQAVEATKRFAISATIDIAQISSAKDTILAAFGSINEVFSSSGDLMASLFTSLNDASFSDKPAFMDAIKNEQKIREKQLSKQEELINANIEMMNSVTAANSRPMVLDIQANGMELELEAFMWKILERIQMRVSASKDEFLLGLAAGGV